MHYWEFLHKNLWQAVELTASPSLPMSCVCSEATLPLLCAQVTKHSTGPTTQDCSGTQDSCTESGGSGVTTDTFELFLERCCSLSLFCRNLTVFPSPFRCIRSASRSEGLPFLLMFSFLYPSLHLSPPKSHAYLIRPWYLLFKDPKLTYLISCLTF